MDGDSIYSLVVCIFTIIALLIGVYAGITLKRPFLFVVSGRAFASISPLLTIQIKQYMCMAAVILCLWVVSAVWAIFDSDGVDWYTFTLGVINTLCWVSRNSREI